MTTINKEKLLDDYPIPISIKCTKIILEQMKKCIFKISNRLGKGTGFFCQIPFKNKKFPVMMTCNHILNEEILLENKELIVTLNDEEEKIHLNIDENRTIYTNKDNFDITIIEIKEDDKIINFLELDERVLDENSDLYNENIYITHYPQLKYDKQKAAVSYGILKEIQNNSNIVHYCSTKPGSSGSPILNISNNKVIGVHKEGSINYNFNCGTYLKEPINEYLNNINLIRKSKTTKNEYLNNNNEIKKSKTIKNEIKNVIINDKNEINNEIGITLKIEKEDIGQKIYYLDNTDGMYYCNGTYMELKHDKLKELNDLNVELSINKKKFKYKKYFVPECEGIYEIHLKLITCLKDCSFMFSGCRNIININLSSFYTKNITDMSCMFSGCELIKDLDLSSFNTKKVTNMSYMFYECKNITNLDLSSFDTKNVLNMSCMFSGCNNLTNLNITSFNTTNVKNMKGMFSDCKTITNLNLSSFNTKNVNDMSGMFYSCKNIKELNLSAFNTKNVTNMSCIFYSCKNIINLNLSSFDTKNVTNMDDIFFHCKKLSTIKINKIMNEKLINKISHEETEIIENE